MKNDEPKIEKFFSEIKEFDKSNLEIPEFELPNRKVGRFRYLYLIPTGIAAALLVGLGFYRSNDTGGHSTNEMVITMTIEPTTNTNNLIESQQSISSWKSPTNTLINEFED